MPEVPDHAVAAQTEATMDVVSLLTVLRRRLRGALVAFVVVAAAVLAYQRHHGPSYEAEVALLVQGQRGVPGGALLGQASGLLGMSLGADTTATHAALLRGTDLIVQAASELGRNALTETERMALCRSVTAEVIPNTDVVQLRVTDQHPGFAADLANLIASKHIATTEDQATQATQELSAHVAQLMLDMQKRADASADDVMAYKTTRGITDPRAEAAMGMTVLGELAQAVATARAEHDGAMEQANALRRELQQTDASYVASSTIARNPLVSELEKTLASLETERAGLEAGHGDGYASVQELRRQIEQVRGQLSDAVETVVADQIEATNPQYIETAKMLSTAESEAIAAGARLGALQPILDRERARLDQLPVVENELGALERQAASSSEAWVALFTKLQELKINEVLARPSLRVVTEAREPEGPTHGPVFQAALSLAIGFLAAMLLTGLAEMRDVTIRSSGEARKLLGLPVLATVPRLRTGHEALVTAQPDMRLARTFRAARTVLLEAGEGTSGPKCIVVTGALGGEGCSVTAANLGVAFSWLGLRTLVVDGDMHSPRQHRIFDLPEAPGLGELLATGRTDPNGACLAHSDFLDVLPAGRADQDGTDLLSRPNAGPLLKTLRERYDVLIADSPAFAGCADALVLGRACDGVVLVVRPGTTPRESAQSAVARMRERGHLLLGLVVVADGRPRERAIL